MSLNYGASCSWGSLSYEELQNNSLLLPTGKLSLNEASLMVTLPNLGGLIGNFVFIYIGERYGHKKTILWLGAPQIVSLNSDFIAGKLLSYQKTFFSFIYL